jgi:Tfp pilus assembly PilM family ATPase
MSRPSVIASWFASPPPGVAIEIGAGRVTGVSIADRGGRLTVTAHASERLADGVVAPALTTPNVADRAALADAVKRVAAAIGGRPRRVALVIPDGAAKVSLVRFEKLPARVDDLAQLVRWQVRKAVPFPLDQAQVSWTLGARDASGASELVVTIARRDIVGEYELACTDAGLEPGVVDLATFNLVNLVLAGDAAARDTAAGRDAEDWLLVHVAPDSSTMAILRGTELILFRNRPAGDGALADLVHQTAMYYEDRLSGRGFSRVLVAPRDLTAPVAAEFAELCRSLASRTGTPVVEVDLRTASSLADRIAPAPELLRALAAPVGALVRDRVA